MTSTGLHIGILCLQIRKQEQCCAAGQVSGKGTFGKFEDKLQISVLRLCFYEWNIKQDLTFHLH